MSNNPNTWTVLLMIANLISYLPLSPEEGPAVAERYIAPPEPNPSLALPCKVVDVYDGDTCTVEIKITTKVRLLDCWAPELNDPGGPKAQQRLEELALNQTGLLVVPLQGKTIGDAFSFDRVLGDVWIEGKDLGTVLVREGHATLKR